MTFRSVFFVAALHARPAVAGLIALTLAATGCGGEGAAGAGPGGLGGPPMAMGVEAITLAAKPVERTTEYIATVKSRRSTTIQPQVEGLITRIAARPGQRVGRGAVLMEIDSGRQQAAVANLESVRVARQAELQWARQQADRFKKLFEAGAVSQQESEQATIAVQTSEAQLKAVEAQIREQRVELAYHRVTAPTAGIVGDIPVRVGDRVTHSTMLTTIDENAGLELYINVPVGQAPDLEPGMAVRVVNDRAQPIATSEINFISPSVDTETQSVLVKAPLQSNAPFRTDQLVRVHLVWSTDSGLTVPLVSVTRINGQYFVYVVENGDGGTTVARQRPVELGSLVGNDYILLSGLKEGERLIVAGIQKIGDGMPVKAVPPGASGADAAPPASEGR
ncbi:MAG: efflux RND transporter periplasmic adaptor subunit [Vicinamibacterales bacterium]